MASPETAGCPLVYGWRDALIDKKAGIDAGDRGEVTIPAVNLRCPGIPVNENPRDLFKDDMAELGLR